MHDNIIQSDAVLKSFIETAVPKIKEYLAPSRIIIFGSRVRGKATEDSDIDVIVISDLFRGIKFVKRMALVLKKVRFPRHVDFICYTPEEFERIRNSSIVVKTAVKEGIAV